jgi:hypothetical protein
LQNIQHTHIPNRHKLAKHPTHTHTEPDIHPSLTGLAHNMHKHFANIVHSNPAKPKRTIIKYMYIVAANSEPCCYKQNKLWQNEILSVHNAGNLHGLCTNSIESKKKPKQLSPITPKLQLIMELR